MIKILEDHINGIRKEKKCFDGASAKIDLFLIEKKGDRFISFDQLVKRWKCTKEYILIFLEKIEKSGNIDIGHFEEKLYFRKNKNKKTDQLNQGEQEIDAFYSTEIEKCADPHYQNFISFLYGANDVDRPLRMLSWKKDQISYKMFEKLMHLTAGKVEILENVSYSIEASSKTYNNFYLTFRNWIKRYMTYNTP